VAVKTLKAANVLELASSEYVDEKLIQFYLEGEALLRMQHPHVVQALGLQRKQAPVQLCLEYCDGGDLVHYLRGCSDLDTTTAMLTEMAAQVAAGIKVSGHATAINTCFDCAASVHPWCGSDPP
jgi:serine/threonine protein kinase